MIARLTALVAAVLAVSIAFAAGSGAESVHVRAESLLVREVPPALTDSVRVLLVATSDTLTTLHADSLASRLLDRAGGLAFRKGEIKLAQEHWRQGVEAARRSGSLTRQATLLNSYGVGLGAGGEMDAAIEIFREQIEVRRALGDPRAEATAWGNLGVAYRHLGRVPETIDAVRHSMPLHRESGSFRGLANGYITLGHSLHDLGQIEPALAAIDSGIAIAKRDTFPSVLGVGLNRRGALRLASGEFEAALADFDSALAVHAAFGLDYYVLWDELSRASALVLLGRPEESLQAIDRALAMSSEVEPERIVLESSIFRGDALFALGRIEEADAVYGRALAVFDEFRSEQGEVHSEAGLFEYGGELSAGLARCRLANGDTLGAWRAVEAHRASILRRQISEVGGGGSLAELQEVLADAGAAVVLFAECRLTPAPVFVVTARSLRTVHISLGPDVLREARLTLDLMAAGAEDAVCAEALSRLSNAVLAPIGSALPRDVQRLYLVPPSSLAGVPFEAMPDPRVDGAREPLGDHYSITYVPSAGVLLQLLAREPGVGRLVAFADPNPAVYERRWGRRIPVSPAENDSLRAGPSRSPLPHARKEVKNIAPGGSRLLVGEAATRAALEDDETARAAIIHFATHAESNPFAAEQSAIILADEEPVRAPSIEALSLRSDLVTLSGCRTNGGYTYLGEGTFGLQRAFLVAGARSVVTSLWDVEDRAAERFMTLFYRGLRTGVPRDRALRDARERMREEGFSHRDRSAFVLTGVGHEPVAQLAGVGGDRMGPQRRLPVYIGLGLGVGLLALTMFLALRRGRT